MHGDDDGMQVKMEPLSYYVGRMERNEPFATGLFGDGELIAVERSRVDGKNSINETYTQELCADLEEVLRDCGERYLIGTDPNFVGHHEEKQLDSFPQRPYYDGVVWDRSARQGELAPLIRQLRKMKVGMIGGQHLVPLVQMLPIAAHIVIPSVDCHAKLSSTLEMAAEFDCDVWLLMMGLAAPVAAYRLQQRRPDAFYIDIGSSFDVLVGAGANRGWREELYADPERHAECIRKNLCG